MAIYHLNVSTGSKAKGQSAKAKADYIEREGKYEDGKEEVAHVEHGNMPDWAQGNPKEYWRMADEHERENGRLFTQVEFALPIELSLDEQIKLAHEFAQSLTADENLPYTLVIHKGEYDHRGNKTDTPENPHVHLIISERINDNIERDPEKWFKRANKKDPEKGGAVKSEILKTREWLCETREQWQEVANAALEHAGSKERIDHRTLEAQGITDRLPQIHKGATAEMQKRGIKTERYTRSVLIADLNNQWQQANKEQARIDAEIAAVKANIVEAVRRNTFERTETDATTQRDREPREVRMWRRQHEAMPLLALSCKYKDYGEKYESNKREISYCDRREREIKQNLSAYQKWADVAQQNIEQLEKGIFGRWRNKAAIAEQEKERDSYQSLVAKGHKELETLPERKKTAETNLKALDILIPLAGEVLREKAEQARQAVLDKMPPGAHEKWQQWKKSVEKNSYRYKNDEHKHQEQLERIFNAFKKAPEQPPQQQKQQRQRGKSQSRGFER